MFKALVQSIVQSDRLARARCLLGLREIGLRTPLGLLLLTFFASLPTASTLAAAPDIRFAAASIRRWWKRMGRRRYPRAKELLITAIP